MCSREERENQREKENYSVNKEPFIEKVISQDPSKKKAYISRETKEKLKYRTFFI